MENNKIKERNGENKIKTLGLYFPRLGASNEFDVVEAVFVATSIPALECMQKELERKGSPKVSWCFCGWSRPIK